MQYQNIMLICHYCTRQFHPAEVGVNAVGGIMMTGKCPDCGLPNMTETTVEDVIHNVQVFQINSAVEDLAEVIVHGKPH